MPYGKLQISYRGTIVRVPELKQTKSGKMVLNIDCVHNNPGAKEGDYTTVSIWGNTAQKVYRRFADGTYQKGDILCVDDAIEQIRAYVGKDGEARWQRTLLPNGVKREKLGPDGVPVVEFFGGFEFVFGPKHVYQSDAVVPDPAEERQAIPPDGENTPFVQVEDGGELPWD